MYAHSTYYWADKSQELTEAAVEVYARRPLSLRRVRSVVEYLHDGVKSTPKAIEILFLADRDQWLDSWPRFCW